MIQFFRLMHTELDATRRRLVRRLLTEVVKDCASAEATYWSVVGDPPALLALVNAGPDPGKLEGLLVPLEGSLVGMVLSTGMAAAMGPEAPYHPAADAVTGTRTEAMAAAPVFVDGNAVGVLSTINPAAVGSSPPRTWSARSGGPCCWAVCWSTGSMDEVALRSAIHSAQGLGVRVLLMDSGVDASHPSLSATSISAFALQNGPKGYHAAPETPCDAFGHGTAIAGLLIAQAPASRCTACGFWEVICVPPRTVSWPDWSGPWTKDTS